MQTINFAIGYVLALVVVIGPLFTVAALIAAPGVIGGAIGRRIGDRLTRGTQSHD